MPEAQRIPDSHKQAFWIYGVTAMIMREPLSVAVHGLAAGGMSARAQLEVLRVLIVFAFLTSQFLAAGVFFDRVYLRPDSAERFARRSYPVDFLTRLIEVLVAVAASTAVGIHSRHLGGLSPFAMVTAVLLLVQPIWLVLARSLGYSTVSELMPGARSAAVAFLAADAVFMTLRVLGLGSGWTEAGALGVVLALVLVRLARQIQTYGAPAA